MPGYKVIAPLFTPEELAEMAAFDAEVGKSDLTMDEIRESRERDKAAEMDAKDNKARKIAAKRREYYAANKEEIAAKRREYRAANREAYNAYMRQYQAKKRAQLAAT